jgi:hypothetical protein
MTEGRGPIAGKGRQSGIFTRELIQSVPVALVASRPPGFTCGAGR